MAAPPDLRGARFSYHWPSKRRQKWKCFCRPVMFHVNLMCWMFYVQNIPRQYALKCLQRINAVFVEVNECFLMSSIIRPIANCHQSRGFCLMLNFGLHLRCSLERSNNVHLLNKDEIWTNCSLVSSSSIFLERISTLKLIVYI